MNIKEEYILDLVNERVVKCLHSNIDRKFVAKWLDNLISNLPENTSEDLLSILYRISDNLLLGGYDNEI